MIDLYIVIISGSNSISSNTSSWPSYFLVTWFVLFYDVSRLCGSFKAETFLLLEVIYSTNWTKTVPHVNSNQAQHWLTSGIKHKPMLSVRFVCNLLFLYRGSRIFQDIFCGHLLLMPKAFNVSVVKLPVKNL